MFIQTLINAPLRTWIKISRGHPLRRLNVSFVTFISELHLIDPRSVPYF